MTESLAYNVEFYKQLFSYWIETVCPLMTGHLAPQAVEIAEEELSSWLFTSRKTATVKCCHSPNWEQVAAFVTIDEKDGTKTVYPLIGTPYKLMSLTGMRDNPIR